MKKIANILEAIWHKLNLTLLKLRRHYYRRYAIYDCISIDGIEIIHEFRDELFEGKLRKYNLEIIPNEFIMQEPCKSTRSQHFRLRPFYLSFHLMDKVIIPRGNEAVTIVHDSRLLFEGGCSIAIRTSIDKGALRKAIITIPTMNSRQETVKESLEGEVSKAAPISPKEAITKSAKPKVEPLNFDPEEIQRQRASLLRTISLVEGHFSCQQ